MADSVPVPLTPDYGGPLVSYADGEFDSRFDRYVTVMEGCFIKFHIFLIIDVYTFSSDLLLYLLVTYFVCG